MITRRKGEFMGTVFGSACEHDRRASPALLPSSGTRSGIFRVALLTLDDRSAYVIDDDLAIAELRARGWQVAEVPWRRAGVQWRSFDAVVIRTTWDCQHDLEGFLSVLADIEATGVTLANPVALVRQRALQRPRRELTTAHKQP